MACGVVPLCAAAGAGPGGENSTAVVSVSKGQRQLFFDDQLIARRENTLRKWHSLKKHPSNPIIRTAPWEAQQYLFGTVLREPEPLSGGGPVFRMWYYTVVDDQAKQEYRMSTSGVGYAVSRDGLRWEKPEMGLYEFNGNRLNNVVYCPMEWKADGTPKHLNSRLFELASVIRDPNPDVRESERYKMLVGVCDYRDNTRADGKRKRADRNYVTLVSPNGIHWQELARFRFPYPPSLVDPACLVWDPYQRLYAIYHRAFLSSPAMRARALEVKWANHHDGNARAVAYATSTDCREWMSADPPVILHVDEHDPDATQIYRLHAWPTGGQWLGLWQNHCSLATVGTIDVGITHSRDGRNWRRVRSKEFLVLKNGGFGEWDRFNQAVASAPVCVGDEEWVYYSGRLYRHAEYRKSGLKDNGPGVVGIGLATIRRDGWCSLQAGFGGGEVLTVPVILPEGELFLNAKADWGQIVVEVIDTRGNVIDGMRSNPIRSDGLRAQVNWPEGKTFKGLPKAAVQLMFKLKNARLYSWQVGR